MALANVSCHIPLPKNEVALFARRVISIVMRPPQFLGNKGATAFLVIDGSFTYKRVYSPVPVVVRRCPITALKGLVAGVTDPLRGITRKLSVERHALDLSQDHYRLSFRLLDYYNTLWYFPGKTWERTWKGRLDPP